MPGSSSGLIVFRISSRVGPARWLLHGDNIPRSSLKLAIGGLVGLATFFDLGSETARSQAPNELVQLPVCSADKAVSDALKGICEVTTLPSGRNRVQAIWQRGQRKSRSAVTVS